MAAAAAAALLDELMGRNRNVAPNEKGIELNWEDPEYCKLYMVKFCPHDLFVNTRADLGSCTKIHDDEVKKLYEESNSPKKIQCLDDFIRFCNTILNDVQRKIEKGQQRLQLMNSNDNVALTPAQTQKNQEQITLLSEKINKLVEEAEAAGIQGNVEQAQGIMKLCDQLKEERNTLRKLNENSQWQQTASMAAEQEKQMEVCEVCGAFLIVGDAQQRIDDHLMGKQHMGYARLKTAVDEVTKERDKLREEREKRRESDRRERYSTYGAGNRGSNGRRDDRDRRTSRNEKERERERDAGRRSRDDDRERDRDRQKRREREGRDRDSREKRERDRDRHRDRKSDREKDKGSDQRSRTHEDDRSSKRHEKADKGRDANGEELTTPVSD